MPARRSKLRTKLEAAYKSRPKQRPRGGSRIPQAPKAVELTYLRAMRALMRDIGRAAKPHITAIVGAVGTRSDAAGDMPTGPILSRLREAVRAIVERHIEAGIVSQVATAANAANLREMVRVLGMDRRALLPDAPLDEWTAENVDLITSIADEYLDQVAELVTEAGDSGMRAETLSDRLQERLGVAESRANLIARDQILKANAQLSQTRMQRVGVTRYIWRATPDSRTRPDHEALDGDTFEFDHPPIVDRESGRRANPGGDYQCRCQAEPVFDDEP